MIKTVIENPKLSQLESLEFELTKNKPKDVQSPSQLTAIRWALLLIESGASAGMLLADGEPFPPKKSKNAVTGMTKNDALALSGSIDDTFSAATAVLENDGDAPYELIEDEWTLLQCEEFERRLSVDCPSDVSRWAQLGVCRGGAHVVRCALNAGVLLIDGEPVKGRKRIAEAMDEIPPRYTVAIRSAIQERWKAETTVPNG